MRERTASKVNSILYELVCVKYRGKIIPDTLSCPLVSSCIVLIIGLRKPYHVSLVLFKPKQIHSLGWEPGVSRKEAGHTGRFAGSHVDSHVVPSTPISLLRPNSNPVPRG